jgi:excinuclease UvrABC nuclease subunit
MKSIDLKKFKLPNQSGVYFFKKNKEIIYIGKATNLKDRVKSYFSKDLIDARGPLILDMVFQANHIAYQETDSVLEALILEAELIKKHQPKYNTKEKDNKSWNYVCITKEKLPKVLVVRGRKLDKSQGAIFGPFTNGLQLREALKIIRRIFPFIDLTASKKQNFEFYRQLGLVPEALVEYKKNIVNLKLFFQGKKKKIIIGLKKEMLAHAKTREFEKAHEIKKKIFALEHINDVALIKEDVAGMKSGKEFFRSGDLPRGPKNSFPDGVPIRIEAYDIAHMSGKNMVGVMTVIEDGEVVKQEYKKFIIRTQSGANDTGALEEVLSRRFRHTEWGLPSLIVLDGSTAQMNVGKRVLDRYQFTIPIAAVVKDDHHKAKAIIGDESIIKNNKKAILLANNEAHRFAIAFHKQKRGKNFLQ